MLRTIRLPSAENVVANGRFQVKLPVGPTYTAVHLKLGTYVVANITNLEVAVNGRVIQRYASATDLDKFNQARGLPASTANGVLTIPFRQNWLEEIEEAELFDLGTARPDYNNPLDAQSPVVESVTISGDLANVSGTITPYAETSSKVRPLRMMLKVVHFPKTMTASSGGTENDFDGYPTQYPNAVLLSTAFKETTAGIISKARVTANIGGAQMEVVENVDDEIIAHIAACQAKPRTDIAGYPMIDFVGSGQLLDGIPLGAASDLRARLTLADAVVTSEVVTVYAFMADTFQGA